MVGWAIMAFLLLVEKFWGHPKLFSECNFALVVLCSTNNLQVCGVCAYCMWHIDLPLWLSLDSCERQKGVSHAQVGLEHPVSMYTHRRTNCCCVSYWDACWVTCRKVHTAVTFICCFMILHMQTHLRHKCRHILQVLVILKDHLHGVMQCKLLGVWQMSSECVLSQIKDFEMWFLDKTLRTLFFNLQIYYISLFFL